jgi:hypothetical protein
MQPSPDERTCGVCAVPHLERNHYFYGKAMTARDFGAEQSYFNQKRWLVNRTVLGWGVVCGLDVEWTGDYLHVSTGLALDCCGRELLVCREECIPIPEWDPECHAAQGTHAGANPRYVLCLRYRECKTEPTRIAGGDCCEEEYEQNRIRDSYAIELLPADRCPPADPQPKLCPLHAARERRGAAGAEPCEQTETVHHYLARSLAEGCPDCEHAECVILAEVEVALEGGIFSHVVLDPYTRRPIVHRNPLLHELVDCYHGDLPRIHSVNWPHQQPLHDKVDWTTFAHLMTCGLEVTFDRKMKPETLHRLSFLVAVTTWDGGTGWGRRLYVPPQNGCIEYRDCAGSPCSKAVFIADDRQPNNDGWAYDEVRGSKSRIRGGTDVEIILRGSLIQSADGKFLDGEAHGFPSGNGTQGGDFVSFFSVAAG